ncbi:hypothetical protein [Sphingomonas sp. R86521]|uniref:hypothetical protein n=1 Tax=Sphingomonas sp. R86521 TaxID=3093860 RepID=UPI0036D3EA08
MASLRQLAALASHLTHPFIGVVAMTKTATRLSDEINRDASISGFRSWLCGRGYGKARFARCLPTMSEIDGVLCFVVSTGGDNGKRLKTEASHWVVPIHPELRKIGFASYVTERRKEHDVRLFADLTNDSLGLYSGKFSKWFSRFLISCDAARERTCFHGLRHSFRDALREARIERDLALTLGGWRTTSGNGAGAVADSYGRGYPRRCGMSLVQVAAAG